MCQHRTQLLKLCSSSRHFDKLPLLKAPHSHSPCSLSGPSRSHLNPAASSWHSQKLPGPCFFAPAFCSGWRVSGPYRWLNIFIITSAQILTPGLCGAPERDRCQAPTTAVSGVWAPQAAALTHTCSCPLGTLKPTSPVSGCQVLKQQLISLGQHVGTLDSWPVAALALGCLQSWHTYG